MQTLYLMGPGAPEAAEGADTVLDGSEIKLSSRSSPKHSELPPLRVGAQNTLCRMRAASKADGLGRTPEGAV